MDRRKDDELRSFAMSERIYDDGSKMIGRQYSWLVSLSCFFVLTIVTILIALMVHEREKLIQKRSEIQSSIQSLYQQDEKLIQQNPWKFKKPTCTLHSHTPTSVAIVISGSIRTLPSLLEIYKREFFLYESGGKCYRTTENTNVDFFLSLVYNNEEELLQLQRALQSTPNVRKAETSKFYQSMQHQLYQRNQLISTFKQKFMTGSSSQKTLVCLNVLQASLTKHAKTGFLLSI